MSRLDVVWLHLKDLAETLLRCVEVAVLVDVDVAHQNEALDVVRMMLQPIIGDV